jgi:hypothetical protein
MKVKYIKEHTFKYFDEYPIALIKEKLKDGIKIKELLKELTELIVDTQKELKKFPNGLDSNFDMEPYEGTPIEDLVNSSYYSGKMDVLDEIQSILMLEL